MKISGVEIPADIEIPELDAAGKAEVDELHETMIRRDEDMRRILAESPRRHLWANMKCAPPPASTGTVTITIEALRYLAPVTRAKVLYMLRDQVTD